MDAFIARENIKRFTSQLLMSRDERQKATLQQLLDAEQQRLHTILSGDDDGGASHTE